MTPIRLLIADDHALVRLGITSVLTQEPDIAIVATAASADEAVCLYRTHRPCVALLDVRMPGIGGIGALRDIRFEFPTACVLMLSTLELDEEVALALEAGARGYLVKTMDAARLATAIRRAAMGERQFSCTVLRRLAERMHLAPREVEVLCGMARGMTNKEIAAKLCLSPHTVKTYVKGVLAKLNMPDRAGAVAAGYERGLLRVEN